jgi:predicted dehydrogenase
MRRLRGLCIGAGYFSRFHVEAWRRIAGVEIVAVCDRDAAKAAAVAREFGVAGVATDPERAMDEWSPDFVDVITPPPSHLPLVRAAAARGLAVICQKPLAPDLSEAAEVVRAAEAAGTPFMVHENFRFQPWYREVRRLLDAGAVGRTLHGLHVRVRAGDGWGADAYLARQPYFRQMPRLLVHETGVHFIDTFRYLAGEIVEVYAVLRRLNPVIAGEDAGLLTVRFAGGAVGLWDANRYNEPNYPDPRYTFGELLVDTDGGSIRLYGDGRLTVQPLGRPETEHPYPHERRGFGGDCVYFTQRHFVEQLRDGRGAFETGGRDYLRTLRAVEAAYRSAETGLPVKPAGDDDAATATAAPQGGPALPP